MHARTCIHARPHPQVCIVFTHVVCQVIDTVIKSLKDACEFFALGRNGGLAWEHTHKTKQTQTYTHTQEHTSHEIILAQSQCTGERERERAKDQALARTRARTTTHSLQTHPPPHPLNPKPARSPTPTPTYPLTWLVVATKLLSSFALSAVRGRPNKGPISCGRDTRRKKARQTYYESEVL
jgi:hypothetical protein